MTTVQRRQPTDSLTEINDILERDGCIIIENALDDVGLRHLQTDIRQNFNAMPMCEGEFFGYATKRMSGLMAKSGAARRMAVDDVMLGVMDHHLLKSCRKYQLNLTQAIQIWPGEPQQIIHTDELLFPFDHPGTQAMINCMWAVDDFTEENGATHVVPGSHLWPKDRQPEPHEIVQGAMPAGSVLIYFGGLLHGGGANRSQKPRTGLVISYCLGWLRQAENQYLAVSQRQAAAFPERLQQLLGYFVHAPNLGCVEGQDPLWVLQGRNMVNARFDEFMPEEIIPVLKEHRAKQGGGGVVFNDRKAYDGKKK